MIGKIKQGIRENLKSKYDSDYFMQWDESTISYDEWIREQEGTGEAQWSKKRILLLESSAWEDNVTGSWLKEKIMKESLPETEIVVLVDKKEQVSNRSLSQIEKVFTKKATVQVLYGDEDEWNSNNTIRMNPWLKPDYSPDTLLSYYYFGKLMAVRKQSLLDACSLPEESTSYTSKQLLYKITLQLCFSLKKEQIYHCKEMLTTSHNISYWGFEETYNEVKEPYQAMRQKKNVEGVSIIIPSKDHPQILERCLNSIRKWTKGISIEIIVVDNGSNPENKERLLSMKEIYGFTYLYEPMEFNFSAMCNLGARISQKELLLFLNDDCEVRQSHWLLSMAKLAAGEQVGAVGAKLYYPNSKRLQHCGIYQTHVGPVHKLQFKEDNISYYDRRNRGIRNVLAVTAACLMVRKKVFDQAEGFDETLQVAFNDVDFCYRLYKLGYDNIIHNEIHLWHHESLSRGSDEGEEKWNRLQKEKRRLYEKHQDLWEKDPYYHPYFSSHILDTNFSFSYEYSPREYAVEVPTLLQALPKKIREEQCVAIMLEYAGNLENWFLDSAVVERIKEQIGTDQVVYLQGNVVVLGSDNGCFETSLLLRHEATGQIYEIQPEREYRPDVFSNLQDQENVALSGFSCFLNMSHMPAGEYEVAAMMKDKISKQYLIRITTRKVVNE